MNTNSNVEQLTDAELDLVNGGSYAGYVATITAETLAVLAIGTTVAPLMPLVVQGSAVLNLVL